ncbi:MAG TPA: chemotaxis protein CheW [Candidatus Koribacter sp.]|jgi:purine-binding chemotaxis protein CheW
MLEEKAMAQQFCTFYLGGLFFGVEVEKVQEVIRYQAMTMVPRASSVVGGLINLRGQIVLAIDLRRRMEMAPRGGDQKPMNVVVRTDDGAVSLLVDEIGDVVAVSQNAFEPPPETLMGTARKMTGGVYKLDGRLLHALDLAAVLQMESPRKPN